MALSRRDLLKAGLKAGVGAAAFGAVPQPLLAYFGAAPEPVPPIQDPRIKGLALRAVEAARGAGAEYADVRLTHMRKRDIGPVIDSVRDDETMTVGARALVDGYWGFASGPVWSPDEMARLGLEAVRQAKAMAVGTVREVALAPAPAARDGHWAMPVEIDPFEVSPLEIVDYLRSLDIFVGRAPGFVARHIGATFRVQEKAFASSEGSYCTQRLYLSEGVIRIVLEKGGQSFEDVPDCLTVAGVGWELFTGQPLRDNLERLMEEMEEHLSLPLKPVDVGRYDVVCDAQTVALLVDGTLGRATELDRALGYEANAGGTSYLKEPLAMVGSYEAGARSLTLTGNRSQRGGAATVQWDDEGVAPDEFAIVQDGVLVDYQTTRESAGWLAGYYAAHGRPVRSHGCALGFSAVDPPLQRTPNLVLAPGREAFDFDAAVAGVDRGIAVKALGVGMDFQGLNGLGRGAKVYEIKDGKRVARIAGAGLLFRAPELWKGLLALGGPGSLRRYGLWTGKGEPEQHTCHSVTATPAVFQQFTVVDALRKA